MGILDLFSKKDEPVKENNDFWKWFIAHEKEFFSAVKNGENIEEAFFDKLTPKLDELRDGFYFLTGMYNDDIAELIITTEGVITNFIFAEELIEVAPTMDNWKFTALKPATEEDISINFNGIEFNKKNISFYDNSSSEFPDFIDVTFVHKDKNDQNQELIDHGVYVFMDNFLGELNLATKIDGIHIIGPDEVQKELVPLEKLKDFLNWREKEFIERYEGVRNNTTNDNYSGLEATLENGLPLVAIINTDLLNWDGKASHPWILNIKIEYDGSKNNGMPEKATYDLLDAIEDEILTQLKDVDGYLNIGRQTADGMRELYFACHEFRKPSKVLDGIAALDNADLSMAYDIYKDKYWQSFDHFKSGY